MVFEEDMEFFEHGIIPGRSNEATSSCGPAELGPPSGMVSLFCGDLVRLATKAHRIGKGDFVWIGYQPWGHEARKKKVTWPRLGFGSQGVMLTKKAAKSIGVFLNSGFKRAGHIDVLLKEWCVNSERFGNVGSCFVWPPVGSYRAHTSDCCPDQFKESEPRPSCWHQDWACAGTRPMHDVHGRSKKLMLPVDKGHQQVLAELTDKDFQDHSLSWITWLDPTLQLWTNVRTERQKRDARKHVRELMAGRVLVKEPEKVWSNKQPPLCPGGFQCLAQTLRGLACRIRPPMSWRACRRPTCIPSNLSSWGSDCRRLRCFKSDLSHLEQSLLPLLMFPL